MSNRYAIGIDLGTTNSALAFQRLEADSKCHVLAIPQLSAPTKLESHEILPSCCYLAPTFEVKHTDLNLPWDPQETKKGYVLGLMAYNHLSTTPELVVQSAKSWLSFADVNRTAPILPWGNNELPSEQKISPLEASSRYLCHLKEAWNYLMAKDDPEASFEKQSITITVPASFDEVAQELTLEAAKQAGYPSSTRLLEEPQAAFYNWLRSNALVSLPQTIKQILICDVGGGTSDFSLLRLTHSKDNKFPKIERVAVSSHLLLGGDNIDLTIALNLENKLGVKLSHQQWMSLVFQARQLKERALANPDEDESTSYHVSITTAGASLFATSLSTAITKQELNKILLDGFFPFCTANAKPDEKVAGLKEFGLPYVNDTAITKHLAAFLNGLNEHNQLNASCTTVDAVLFNGGTLKPKLLQKKLLTLLTAWQNGYEPVQLENSDMDLAVSLGASQYSKNILLNTNKIYANYPRSVYLELENNLNSHDSNSDQKELLCILPKGFEAGHSINIKNHSFLLTINTPVRFQIFTSRLRANDTAGEVVSYNAKDFHPLSPALQTTIKPILALGPKNKELKVQLKSGLSETGLLNIQCVTELGEELSPLTFQLKSSPQATPSNENATQHTQSSFSAQQIAECSKLINLYYGKANKQIIPQKNSTPKTLIKDLENITRTERAKWELPFMRQLWQDLSQGLTRRNRSLAHECSWLNLAGYILRPGYGAELDAFRMEELWKLFELGLAFPKEQSVQLQWAVLWRRVAGGLSRERQQQVFQYIQQQLSKSNSDNPELFRLVASLERIDPDERIQSGNLIVRRLLKSSRSGQEQFCWAFGRLASRIPLYAELNSVVPASKVAVWFEQLATLDWTQPQYQQLNNAFALAGRLTNDRIRDLDSDTRALILKKMQQSHASAEQLQVVREYIEIKEADDNILFGETLPSGLKKIS